MQKQAPPVTCGGLRSSPPRSGAWVPLQETEQNTCVQLDSGATTPFLHVSVCLDKGARKFVLGLSWFTTDFCDFRAPGGDGKLLRQLRWLALKFITSNNKFAEQWCLA